MSELQMILDHLKQPEYIHVLINPLPLYGMAAGAFMLIVSWLAHSHREQTAALLWIAFTAVITWFVVRYGYQGYDRVMAMSTSTDAQLWLKVHMTRAEKTMYVFYFTGVVALAALIARNRWPRVFKGLLGLTLVLTLVCVNLGGWISHAGGQVRHSEFRDGPPRPDWVPKESHHHGDSEGGSMDESDHAHE